MFYATDRAADALPLSAYQLSGQKRVLGYLGLAAMMTALFGGLAMVTKRWITARFSAGVLACLGAASAGVAIHGDVHIEKHGVGYGAERGSLVRGRCRVTVPDVHVRGNIERPSLMKLEWSEDPEKHVVLTEVTELSSDAFDDQLRNARTSGDRNDVMVFIHGYNVTFESAVHRTAQIAVDLPFAGVPICYSWPSQGTLLGYPVDENNVAWSVAHLRDFLTDLRQQHGDAEIHVVAHSMGNRAMTAALQQMALQPQTENQLKPLASVVLAAPDVDADLFRKDLAPALVQVAGQVTLYASSDDQALIASKQVHGYPRAGESCPHLVVVPGVETIDVSGIDLSLLGHSYYGDSRWMLRDLREVIASRLPASERSALVPRSLASMVYYQLSMSQFDIAERVSGR
ncbi:MAG: alpha/beta fold hydrolase [Planctomycetota bacterium]